MSESEALAQAFVSGFCIKDGGECAEASWPWTNLPLCVFGPVPIVFCQSVGWEVSFQVCYLRCPNQRGIPKQSPEEE